MKLLKLILMTITVWSFVIVNIANANTIVYQFSGNLGGLFLPITGDPIADLLGVPRTSTINIAEKIPFTLEMVIDGNNKPNILNDNSISQEVTYLGAILSTTLNINGIVFETPPPSIPTIHKNSIDILNIGQNNLFFLQLATDNDTLDLFNRFTVPFNQTIQGKFYDNVEVGINTLSLSVSGMGLFDGYSLPARYSTLDSAEGLPLLLSFYTRYESQEKIQLGVQLTSVDSVLTITDTQTTPSDNNSNDCIANYKTDGSLKIPCVVVPILHETFVSKVLYHADLEIVPQSNPIQFKLTQAHLADRSLIHNDCAAIFQTDGKLSIPCVTIPGENAIKVMYQAEMQYIPQSNPFFLKLTQVKQKEN